MSTIRRCALVGLAFVGLTGSVWSQEPAKEDSLDRLSERDLIAKAPVGQAKAWRPIDSVEDVPEVCFEEMFNERRAKEDADKDITTVLEKIRRLERKRPGGFVAAVKKHRPDLAGLPFLVGKETEMDPRLCKDFFELSRTLSKFTHPMAFRFGFGIDGGVGRPPVPPESPSTICRSSIAIYESSRTSGLELLSAKLSAKRPAVKSNAEFLTSAFLAKQRLFPLNTEGRMALTQLLQATPLTEVNALLAQVALYAPEPDIREVAVQSLNVRRGDGHEGVFLEGLKYPLPSVANNAADAIIKLELKNLLPKIAELVDDLDGQVPDRIDGRVEVREVVKINHSRNCVLCHSPASLPLKGTALSLALAARVPNPKEPLPDPASFPYYGIDDLATSIRFDVTYLRPDFSLTLPVDAHYAPWPEQQRFDFLVRTRILRAEEAAAFEKARPFLPRSPNREAALRVLRELTGEDAGNSSEAWIKLLDERAAAAGAGLALVVI